MLYLGFRFVERLVWRGALDIVLETVCYGSALMVRLAMPGTPAAGHKWASKDDISLFQHRTANLTTRRG